MGSNKGYLITGLTRSTQAEKNMPHKKIAKWLRFEKSDGSPAYEVLDNEETETFIRKLIRYESKSGKEIRAYLLEPKENQNGTGIMVYHQHASRWHLGKSEPAGLAGDPYNQFGPALAAAGNTVICPDCIGFEDRRRIGAGIDECEETDWLQYYNGMAYRLVMGEYLITEILSDGDLALNILINHRNIKSGNVGVLGHSFGGNTVLFHAALDSRIRFACASGAACTVRTKMERETGLEMALLIPGFFKAYDMDDLVECISPRKLFLVSGKDDPYSFDAREIYEKTKIQWIKAVVPDNISHMCFGDGHEMNSEKYTAILNWMNSNIK